MDSPNGKRGYICLEDGCFVAGMFIECECDNEVLVFYVIIPLFKFADALALPQWDARFFESCRTQENPNVKPFFHKEQVSKLRHHPKTMQLCLFFLIGNQQNLGGL